MLERRNGLLMEIARHNLRLGLQSTAADGRRNSTGLQGDDRLCDVFHRIERDIRRRRAESARRSDSVVESQPVYQQRW